MQVLPVEGLLAVPQCWSQYMGIELRKAQVNYLYWVPQLVNISWVLGQLPGPLGRCVVPLCLLGKQLMENQG